MSTATARTLGAPTLGYTTDVGAIRTLLLNHPRDAFAGPERIEAQWRALNYEGRPDLPRAVDEYEALVAAIRALTPELEVSFLAGDEQLTMDSLYVRDAAIASPRGMILCNMGKPARRGEPAAQRALYEKHGIPLAGAITGEGRIEGGDVAWLDERTLAVGWGYRTNAEGIRQLQALLEGSGVEVIVAHLPHYRGPADVFHLMSALSPIGENLALVYSALLTVPFRNALLERGLKLVEVPEAEFDSMGCNVLAVAPGKCIMVDRNPETRRRLEAAGAEVTVIKGDEICRKGAGGPTCLTRPLLRELRG